MLAKIPEFQHSGHVAAFAVVSVLSVENLETRPVTTSMSVPVSALSQQKKVFGKRHQTKAVLFVPF